MKQVKEYSVYRTNVLLFALVDREGIPTHDTDPQVDWPTSPAEWIRNNDETTLARYTAILKTFHNDLVDTQDK